MVGQIAHFAGQPAIDPDLEIVEIGGGIGSGNACQIEPHSAANSRIKLTT